MPGIVYLYFEDQLIDQSKYPTPYKLQTVKDRWKRIYGPAYLKASVIEKEDPPKPKGRPKSYNSKPCIDRRIMF